MKRPVQRYEDTAANWAALDPILPTGWEGVESDTGLYKQGDGRTAWAALDYVGGDTAGGVDQLPGKYCLAFSSGNNHHVKAGPFWLSGVAYTKCFVDLWAKVGDTLAGYVISAGYGGVHNILFGFDTSTGRVKMTGNMANAAAATGATIDQSTFDTTAKNEWHHYALHYDKAYITLYVDGVPVKRTAYTSNRMTNTVQDPVLFIGGSDHSNYIGKLARLRIFENATPFDADPNYGTPIVPERYFGNAYLLSGALVEASVIHDYTMRQGIIIDHSSGLAGVKHPGVRSRGASVGSFNTILTYDESTLPQWTVDEIERTPTTLTPAAVPVGALAFDSFNRNDVTYAWQSVLGLGSTEGGSLGPLAWSGSTNYGILHGKAFSFQGSLVKTPAVVNVGTANQKVSAYITGSENRRGGVVTRYVDDNNYIIAAVYENDNTILIKRVAGVETVLGVPTASPAATSTTNGYKITLESTSAHEHIVYINDVELFRATDAAVPAGTRAGIYSPCTFMRFDEFTVQATS